MGLPPAGGALKVCTGQAHTLHTDTGSPLMSIYITIGAYSAYPLPLRSLLDSDPSFHSCRNGNTARGVGWLQTGAVAYRDST